MDFSQAEEKFRELQARVQRGEPLSEDQYQEELAKLMVQDDRGTFWSLEPGTGRWLYFNGTEWMPGTPPRPVVPTQPPMPIEPMMPVETTSTMPLTTMPSTEAEDMGRYGAAGMMGTGMASAPMMEPEQVPTYMRASEAAETAPFGQGGIPPRPVRENALTLGPTAERAWLPFALGAIVLGLCAVVLFFGVRGFSFLSGSPQPTATATQVAVIPQATATTSEGEPTNTAAPTAVPATKVAASATPSAITVTANDTVNIRSGPGTNFKVLAKLASGTSATVVARSEDSKWFEIQIPNKTDLGWVNADFVSINGDVNKVPIVTPTPKAGNAGPTETPAG